MGNIVLIWLSLYVTGSEKTQRKPKFKSIENNGWNICVLLKNCINCLNVTFLLKEGTNNNIKSYKSPTSHFNIKNYLQFSSSNTRFGSSAKLVHHRCSTNLTHHFYFHRIPCLWNSLPTVVLTAQITSFKHKLYICMWNHFIQEFNDNDVHIPSTTSVPVASVLEWQNLHFTTNYHNFTSPLFL